jgi:hypothetical protein
LLGINTDPERELTRRRDREREINWRSWWDGGLNGRVALAWRIPGLPFVVLIDHEGKVRHRGLDGSALLQTIERLVNAVPPTR